MAKIKHDLIDCIQTCDDLIETATYDLKKAKHPSKKRTLQNQFDFWSSMSHHLTEYQKMVQKKPTIPQFPMDRIETPA